MNSMELFERRDELKSVITDLRAEQKDVEQQLSDLFLPLARDALRADGKDFGTAHIVEGNVAMKVNVANNNLFALICSVVDSICHLLNVLEFSNNSVIFVEVMIV